MATVSFDSLRLVNDIKVGFELSLLNNINTKIPFDSVRVRNNIREGISFSLTLKYHIRSRDKVDFSIGLVNHIFDSNSGITYGTFELSKSWGI